jgi:ABC-type transporter Mla subunit MlaD
MVTIVDMTLGNVAYATYGNAVGWRDATDRPLRDWADLPPDKRAAWEATARAVTAEAREPASEVDPEIERLTNDLAEAQAEAAKLREQLERALTAGETLAKAHADKLALLQDELKAAEELMAVAEKREREAKAPEQPPKAKR